MPNNTVSFHGNACGNRTAIGGWTRQDHQARCENGPTFPLRQQCRMVIWASCAVLLLGSPQVASVFSCFVANSTVCSMNIRRSLGVVCGIVLVTQSLAAAVIDATWSLPGSGSWSTAGHWDVNQVPSNNGADSYRVWIDGDPTTNAVVSLDASVQVDAISISSGDALSVMGATLTVIGGSLENNGTVTLQLAGLELTAPTTIFTGSGNLEMGDATSRVIGTGILSNEATHTIQGAGILGDNSIGLTNFGSIIANQPMALVIDPSSSGVQNSGTMEALDGGTLRLTGGAFDNTGGTIRAGTGSTVELDSSADIVGGTLESLGTGVISVTSTQILSANCKTQLLRQAACCGSIKVRLCRWPESLSRQAASYVSIMAGPRRLLEQSLTMA